MPHETFPTLPPLRHADPQDHVGLSWERLHLVLLHCCLPVHWRAIPHDHQVTQIFGLTRRRKTPSAGPIWKCIDLMVCVCVCVLRFQADRNGLRLHHGENRKHGGPCCSHPRRGTNQLPVAIKTKHLNTRLAYILLVILNILRSFFTHFFVPPTTLFLYQLNAHGQLRKLGDDII